MTIRDLIKRQEGNGLPGKPFEAYKCPRGRWTIGWGHNIEARGLKIRESQAEDLLTEDINDCIKSAARCVRRFYDMDEIRQAVVISMIFQMGENSFRGFENTIRYLNLLDFEMASVEMLDSPWAKVQTPGRALELSKMMLTGSWNP